jgi:hypothetical protein
VGYPLINESTTSECDAFERAAVRFAASKADDASHLTDLTVGHFFQGMSQGQLASLWVKDEYPSLPPVVGCTVLYWKGLVQPDSLKKDIKKLSS